MREEKKFLDFKYNFFSLCFRTAFCILCVASLPLSFNKLGKRKRLLMLSSDNNAFLLFKRFTRREDGSSRAHLLSYKRVHVACLQKIYFNSLFHFRITVRICREWGNENNFLEGFWSLRREWCEIARFFHVSKRVREYHVFVMLDVNFRDDDNKSLCVWYETFLVFSIFFSRAGM